jgi:acetylornithine deacetylase/succinyl-diaminopimelate desuccinylase-like protein
MALIDDYKKFLSFPSISSEPEFKKDLLECMEWLKAYIEQIGLKTEVWPTDGHPVLFASYQKDPSLPTLLIYNHYDVQPVDPIDLWNSPPFEPTLKEDNVYARGAQDNKGQLFYVLQALKDFHGKFPINIKWVIEGEEEVGSPGLDAILSKYKQELKADSLAIVDCGIPNQDTPAVTLGMRGLFTIELEATGTRSDLHSGSHGGLAYNPLRALTEVLAFARDAKGHITIPGFYDKISPLTREEKDIFTFDFNPSNYEKEFGVPPTGGETDFPPLERNWLRPTLEINGLWGGYIGKGFKTVIPSKAYAKLSCRVVRGQDPAETAELVGRYFESKSPPGVTIKAHIHSGGGPAVLTTPHSPAVKAFADAFTEVFKKPCRYIIEGASIPIVAKLAETSGADAVLVGLGLATDNIHAPNEHFSLTRINQGIEIVKKAIYNLSKK